MSTTLNIGLFVFPDVTQLDLTGPLQAFTSVPLLSDHKVAVHLVGKTLDPVQTDAVMVITPTVTFADCPQLDVICVPGGYGTDALLGDAEFLDFLRAQAVGARYVTSVCTGSLVLGAAGLLEGYKATTHWTAVENLAAFGAIYTDGRVVVDRNRVTGGGITAGIDFALTVIAELFDRETAEAVQLRMEYNPAPPFTAGSPETAPKPVVDAYLARIAERREYRREQVLKAAALLRD